jgi:hypothetical protein
MGMIEIPLHSFRYRFRSLTWQEEFRIPFSVTEDQRKTLLSHALVDISGLKISSVAEARMVLDQIPPALFWRIWVVYRGSLPEDRYYTTKGLYDAPDLKPQLGRWKIAWTLRKPGRLEPLNGRLWRTRNNEEHSSRRVNNNACSKAW